MMGHQSGRSGRKGSILPVLLLLSLAVLLGGCATLASPTATPAEPTTEPWATITDQVELPAVSPGLAAVAFESRRSL